LSQAITELRDEYQYIRVVAHSLGCMHIIEGIDLLPSELKPEEVHLCGAAVTEQQVVEKLQRGIGREHVFHYYATKDYLLNYLFSTITMGQVAIGANPLKGVYDSIISQCVDEHFDFFVHNTYAHNFHKFAIPAKKQLT
jgi:hypothetical protein